MKIMLNLKNLKFKKNKSKKKCLNCNIICNSDFCCEYCKQSYLFEMELDDPNIVLSDWEIKRRKEYIDKLHFLYGRREGRK